ncbi:hypothetical protein BASA81_002076 [Batrachochytrium salamandrivorans]|nr:hypothetical protein BASA81_002076 [Batrachochytrium salamandrivorans]
MRHLVVFVHGYVGAESDFDNMARGFALSSTTLSPESSNVVALKIATNLNTHDGVERGSVRIFKEIQKFVKDSGSAVDGGEITEFSIVGHSLGGLYARFVIRLLDECGFFTTIRPRCFVTLATPHLSIRRSPKSTLSVGWQWVAQSLCQTTRELCLEDKHNLLLGMTEQHYLRALGRFDKRVLYSNVLNDQMVHYSTASISLRNPYSNPQYRQASPDFPSLTAWSLVNVKRRLKHDLPVPVTMFQNDLKQPLLTLMFDRLNALEWERYDCLFYSVFAHEQIINKRQIFSGQDVVQHLLTRVMFPNSNL